MSTLTPIADPTPRPATAMAPGSAEVRTPALKPDRLQSLDAYRGLIMVTLAFHGFGLAGVARNHLETTPQSGFWAAVLRQFDHVEWVGGGYWDLIQPSFMFMVGVSMAYSYVHRARAGASWGSMFRHALWRALALIVLGIFLISNSRRSTEWMLTNVLTQIGLGYPLLFLLWRRSTRTHLAALAAILVGTWALYVFYPHAGVDPTKGAPPAGVTAAWAQQHLAGVAPAWHKNANVGAALDNWLLNLFPRPEPFRFNVGGYATLNFLPSLATMLLGLMAGELLRSNRDARDKLRLLAVGGFVAIGAGVVLSWLGVPLVKRIWTPSWALYSAGWCGLILATLYAVIDVRRHRAWGFPLVVVGMNSMAMYCLHMTLTSWTAKTLQTHLGQDVFKILGPLQAPFVQATLVGLVFWLVCWWMYRRQLFLRI